MRKTGAAFLAVAVALLAPLAFLIFDTPASEAQAPSATSWAYEVLPGRPSAGRRSRGKASRCPAQALVLNVVGARRPRSQIPVD